MKIAAAGIIYVMTFPKGGTLPIPSNFREQHGLLRSNLTFSG